jgi:metacaspase-1
MKSALLVGINDYPGTANDLHGCLNDATNVYDVLVKYFGFSPGDIRLLQDGRATRQAIVSGLETLVGRAAPGDTLVFQYSGHGSQVRDKEGDELADGKDEIICPYDFTWDGSWVSDDELSRIFSALKKGVRLEVILDSCHSGTGTREIVLDRTALGRLPALGLDRADCGDVERALWASPCCLRHRYVTPPADIALRADEIFGEDLPVQRLGVLKAAGGAEKMGHVLWAACRSNQFSADAEIGGKPSGAFTYYFCRHIRDSGGKITRSDLLKRVRASLKHEGFSQVPQLEGPAAEKSREVFGGAG